MAGLSRVCSANAWSSEQPTSITNSVTRLRAFPRLRCISFYRTFHQTNYSRSSLLTTRLEFRPRSTHLHFAQGVESEVQYGIGKNIFLRGGYTYLDSVVQRSFSSDALQPTYNTSSSFPNVPIGVYSPLRGARPFRRPPHTGFVSATYTGKHFTVVGNGAFSSRSDDSTFLGFSDANFGNSLLLPNRNL